jgi:predicted lipid-binding transport protein (Tim44 family)
MKKKTRITILMSIGIAAVCVVYFSHDVAEAARLGGGSSFGSRPSYQRSAPAPTPSPTSPQLSPGQPTQQRPVAGSTPSPMGRWGGMLGGLLMGGLIGSLLFGGAHAFGGPGMLDIVILGGCLFLLYRFLRARRMAKELASAGGPMPVDRVPVKGWGGSGYASSSETSTAAAKQPAFPPGFDADEFLKGAKTIYTRLQASWDKRDLDDIRQFTSPEVFAEIEHQAQEDPKPGQTELLLINPRVTEVREIDNQTVASVLYDVMIRENGNDTAKQIRELWHFSRDIKSWAPTGRLREFSRLNNRVSPLTWYHLLTGGYDGLFDLEANPSPSKG